MKAGRTASRQARTPSARNDRSGYRSAENRSDGARTSAWRDPSSCGRPDSACIAEASRQQRCCRGRRMIGDGRQNRTRRIAAGEYKAQPASMTSLTFRWPLQHRYHHRAPACGGLDADPPGADPADRFAAPDVTTDGDYSVAERAVASRARSDCSRSSRRLKPRAVRNGVTGRLENGPPRCRRCAVRASIEPEVVGRLPPMLAVRAPRPLRSRPAKRRNERSWATSRSPLKPGSSVVPGRSRASVRPRGR